MNLPLLKHWTAWLWKQAAELDPGLRLGDLSIVLMDHQGITSINRDWLNHDFSTDVISFLLEPVPGEEGRSAEVFVNVCQAVEEGEERGDRDRELALYVAHGCHHLTGADDDTPEKKTAMLEQENAWLDLACVEMPYAGLIG